LRYFLYCCQVNPSSLSTGTFTSPCPGNLQDRWGAYGHLRGVRALRIHEHTADGVPPCHKTDQKMGEALLS
jgi:hypothetical protein